MRNLTEIAEAWHDWDQKHFKLVAVEADKVVDSPAPPTATGAICAWPGSLQSTHTLVRHVDRMVPVAYRVTSAVQLIGLHAHDDARIERLRGALAGVGVPLIVARTHVRAMTAVDGVLGAMSMVAAVLHFSMPPRRNRIARPLPAPACTTALPVSRARTAEPLVERYLRHPCRWRCHSLTHDGRGYRASSRVSAMDFRLSPPATMGWAVQPM